MSRKQANPTTKISTSLPQLKAENDLRKLLNKLPFKLPMRTRLDVIEADKALGRDSTLMTKTAKAIAAIVLYVQKSNSCVPALVSNAMICRFDCVYFVVKRLTNCRDQESKDPMEFAIGQKCLPLYNCPNISRLFLNSLREAGAEVATRYLHEVHV